MMISEDSNIEFNLIKAPFYTILAMLVWIIIFFICLYCKYFIFYKIGVKKLSFFYSIIYFFILYGGSIEIFKILNMCKIISYDYRASIGIIIFVLSIFIMILCSLISIGSIEINIDETRLNINNKINKEFIFRENKALISLFESCISEEKKYIVEALKEKEEIKLREKVDNFCKEIFEKAGLLENKTDDKVNEIFEDIESYYKIWDDSKNSAYKKYITYKEFNQKYRNLIYLNYHITDEI